MPEIRLEEIPEAVECMDISSEAQEVDGASKEDARAEGVMPAGTGLATGALCDKRDIGKVETWTLTLEVRTLAL